MAFIRRVVDQKLRQICYIYNLKETEIEQTRTLLRARRSVFNLLLVTFSVISLTTVDVADCVTIPKTAESWKDDLEERTSFRSVRISCVSYKPE